MRRKSRVVYIVICSTGTTACKPQAFSAIEKAKSCKRSWMKVFPSGSVYIRKSELL
jgi:hypothetical protein